MSGVGAQQQMRAVMFTCLHPKDAHGQTSIDRQTERRTDTRPLHRRLAHATRSVSITRSVSNDSRWVVLVLRQTRRCRHHAYRQ